MAREERRVELRPVDETEEVREPVLRLESDETRRRTAAGRAGSTDAGDPDSQRLDLPAREAVETRTHQPGVEALIEQEILELNPLEGNWGEQAAADKPLPWGWFALIAVILTGGTIWSLMHVKQADVQAKEIRQSTQQALSAEAAEQRKAAEQLERIDAAKAAFFNAGTIDALAAVVRDPERVRPMMESYYRSHPLKGRAISRTRSLQPVNFNGVQSFWTSSVMLDDGETRNLVLELLKTGEVKVDWETFVRYQPIEWNTFVRERPAGKSFDFRVYIERDNMFSHEFSDGSKWACFLLTVPDSVEVQFGYVRLDTPLCDGILAHLKNSRDRKCPVILRVNIPEGLQSPRGVVIEKLMSTRWLYVTPPDAGS